MNETVQRVRVYIDGFNFYYAAFVDGTFGRWKWLDLVAMVPRKDKGKRQHRGSVFEGEVKFVREVRQAYLMDSQLPLTIEGKHGRLIQRPPEWGPVDVERP